MVMYSQKSLQEHWVTTAIVIKVINEYKWGYKGINDLKSSIAL